VIAAAVVAALATNASEDGDDGHWSVLLLAGAQMAFDAATLVCLLVVTVVSQWNDLASDVNEAGDQPMLELPGASQQ
jgi:hypothetical protein